MYILGISAFYHDSAAAITQSGNILSACQEERFTRIKHDASFPKNAIQACIKNSGIDYYSLKEFWYAPNAPIAQKASEFGLGKSSGATKTLEPRNHVSASQSDSRG